MAQSNLQEIIAHALARTPCRVYLFGSQATGAAQPGSDVGIGVTAESDVTLALSQLRLALEESTIAYQGRTALGKGFQQVTVKPLTEEHVTALVEHAHAHLYRFDPALGQKKSRELLQGIQRLEAERRARLGAETERLIDSPLLVRMLLIVHYRERRLPEQRAELYMKATDAMLLPDYAPDADTAAEIGQLVGGSWEVHRDLVQHLAFHMHRRGPQQGREIKESDLRRLLRQEPAYAPLVDDFTALTRLRGTLLEERLGSYRFLHLGFQEFLAARYLAEIVRSEGGIAAIVDFLEEGPVQDSWWREVTLLVAGYFAVTSPQTAQTFLERLAGVDSRAHSRPALPPDVQLTAAELAAVAWLEWPAQREALRQKLADRLVNLFATHASGALRALAGQTLDRLGDPRPGVGFVLRGSMKIPEIAWGGEVSAGTYSIGGDKDAYGGFKRREVQIKMPFRLSRYPITYAQFQCFVEAADFNDRRWWRGIPESQKQIEEQRFQFGNHPRENVSWYQAMAFCRWLTAKLCAGELLAEPLADDREQYVITLPHEYEWEVAARWPPADSQQRIYPWGPRFDAARANTAEGKINQPTAVGIYPSGQNAALELYDLSGNVWEWCRNKYDEPADDRVDGTGGWRALRGGSWHYTQHGARAADRNFTSPPTGRDASRGFRVAVVCCSSSHHPDR